MRPTFANESFAKVRVCDHTSVGILVRSGSCILLIERRQPPVGFALPAGHVDRHGTFEQAAIAELSEEVGLSVKRLELLAEGRKNNPCRRAGGTWHYWKVFEAEVAGNLNLSASEVRRAVWASAEMIDNLMARTKLYLSGKISEQDWSENPGLEPVWLEWFGDLQIGNRNDGV